MLKKTPLVSESGWIPVNPNTLETRFQDIYAIGDVNFIPLKNGKPLPKAGVIAHSEAEIVSYNLAQKWKGSEKRRTFQGEGFCFLDIGDNRAGLGKGYFYEDPPRMKLYQPNKFWHWGKVLFEKYWLWKWY
jgi:sulfide:quinone oxidoreductase